MTNEELISTITSWNPDIEVVEDTQLLNVIVPKDKFIELITRLKEDSTTHFDYMFCLTCVDWPEHFQMVYHLKSSDLDHMIVLKVNLEDKNFPEVETVCTMYSTAEFHEREVYDLFGVKFLNHPDLRRILLEDEWVGYPLRKDYVDEINIVTI
jgi:NADH:ubiquinone oxidoreductase subunit C